ncbi:MAG: DUF697 domain-containing protein [Planctomycetes bacterium]|nr:DUF697 domain-containing protein [Planctomycetota bacterium]
MFNPFKKLASARTRRYHERLEQLIKQTPIPVFWLFGKTQSGKTSIIKFLTGADDAEIGRGFKPCTRFSREYRFPTDEAPLLIFLDTRGLEEPGYDPDEDIARFGTQAHVVIVTARLLDFAMHDLLRDLRKIRHDQPKRPVLLALTCLHDAYPQQQHPEPYPFAPDGTVKAEARAGLPDDLLRSIEQQRQQFDGFYDFLTPVDLTRPEDGFTDCVYGGGQLKETLIKALPDAYRATLMKLDEATHSLQDLFEWRALPHILGFSSLAATAGAIPIPWLDLFILPGIQTQMVFDLARLYGQPLTGQRFLEIAGTLGLGMAVRQGIREFTKFIPVVGSVAGAALAGSATFALGKAFCYYYGAIHKGHVPKSEELKHYYREQLAEAERLWRS